MAVGLAVLEGRKVEAHSIKAAHAWDTEAEVDASTTLTVQKVSSFPPSLDLHVPR